MRLRITGWDENYESSTTRRVKTLNWVPVPNRHDGDGYTELLEHANGAAHLGAWVVILQVASKCSPRGVLVKGNGKPHTALSIARMARFPQAVLEEAIPRLIEIGWLEADAEVEQDQASHTSNNGRLNTIQPANNESATTDSERLNDVQLSRARAEGKGREGKGREQKGRKGSARGRAPDPPPADPPAEEKAKLVLTVPIEGGNAGITQQHVDAWAEAFPEVDVGQVLRQVKCHYQAPGVRLQATEAGLHGRIRRWIQEDLRDGKAPLRLPDPPAGWQRPTARLPGNGSAGVATIRPPTVVSCGACGWRGLACQATATGDCPECGQKAAEEPLPDD